MSTYNVTYYVRATGALLDSMDRHVPWDAILPPPTGQLARCESDWDHIVTWLAPGKVEIPAPTFA
jgi:hypothetical protein